MTAARSSPISTRLLRGVIRAALALRRAARCRQLPHPGGSQPWQDSH
jgi:hypothetical protein